MATRLELLDQPLALAARYLDDMPDATVREAARAAAWKITLDEGGWALGNRIYFHHQLAELLERDLPLWLAVARTACDDPVPAS